MLITKEQLLIQELLLTRNGHGLLGAAQNKTIVHPVCDEMRCVIDCCVSCVHTGTDRSGAGTVGGIGTIMSFAGAGDVKTVHVWIQHVATETQLHQKHSSGGSSSWMVTTASPARSAGASDKAISFSSRNVFGIHVLWFKRSRSII